mmetsp:Transcript_19384/g.28195  ORF Transcript_19384/g.28195 Transcript_19384/m.28195 type:complete len:167 (+) Transcript_19384:101-601(+)
MVALVLVQPPTLVRKDCAKKSGILYLLVTRNGTNFSNTFFFPIYFCTWLPLFSLKIKSRNRHLLSNIGSHRRFYKLNIHITFIGCKQNHDVRRESDHPLFLQRQQKVQQLKDSGKKGMPVMEETFKAWQEKQKRKLVEAEMKKKKGGKGLSVLTRRAFYEYKKGPL